MECVLVNSGCYHKYHSLGGSNNKLFLTVLEAGKSKIKVLADLDLVGTHILGWQIYAFLLCPNMIEKGGREGERKRERERERARMSERAHVGVL